MATSPHSLLPLFFFFFFHSLLVNGDLSIADYGARGDGKTDASHAFLEAWSLACGSSAPVTIVAPRKRYLLSPVVFQGPCKNSRITFRLEGILVAPTDFRDMGSSDNWILFSDVRGVSIVGGLLDGEGSSMMWACKDAGHKCPDDAASLAFFDSKDVVINGLTSIKNKLTHIEIHTSENVTVQGVKIIAPDESPNTDGIHVQQSTGVNILKTGIRTGDDCISIGPGTRNLWIQNVACGPGHGISIGSLAKGLEEEGVQNVTVKTVVFNQTQNGLRIKAWARPSRGFVQTVVFQHVVMINVKNPIIIDQHYWPNSDDDCPDQHSGIKISGVTYKDIRGTSASKVAVTFDCSASSPCKQISLQDKKLTYGKQLAKSFGQNAKGIVRGLVVPPSCL